MTTEDFSFSHYCVPVDTGQYLADDGHPTGISDGRKAGGAMSPLSWPPGF